MSESTVEKAEYGNWVSTRLIFVPGALSLLFGGSAVFVPVLGVAAVFFFLWSLYFSYARHAFSPNGRNIQDRIRELVIDRIVGWDGTGRVLDIGCGSGSFSIRIANAIKSERSRRAQRGNGCGQV